MELHRLPPCRGRARLPQSRIPWAAVLDPPGCPHRSLTQGCSVFQTPVICNSPFVCLPCILQTSRGTFLSLPRAKREGVLGSPAECG